MSDVTTVSDLETNKKHITFCNEVITGLEGGLAGGAQIATATNAVTGQAQKTLPKVIEDLGPQYFADWPGAGDPPITLTNSGQALRYQLADGGDGHDYCWSGSFPKVVAAGSTPTPLGSGGWIDRSDLTLRVDLADSDGGIVISGELAVDVARASRGDDYTYIQDSASRISKLFIDPTQSDKSIVITGDSLSVGGFGYPDGLGINGAGYATGNPFGMSSWAHMIRDAIFASHPSFTPIERCQLDTTATISWLSSEAQFIKYGMNSKAALLTFASTSKTASLYSAYPGSRALIVSYAPAVDACLFSVNGVAVDNTTPDGRYGGHGYMIIPVSSKDITITNVRKKSDGSAGTLAIYGCGSPTQTVANLTGKGQWTSGQILAEYNTLVAPYSPDVIFYIIGANDIGFGLPISEFSSNVMAFISTARAAKPGCEIVLLSTPPCSSYTREFAKPYIKEMLRIAKDTGSSLIDLWSKLEGIPVSEWRFDNIHFSTKGDPLVFDIVKRAVFQSVDIDRNKFSPVRELYIGAFGDFFYPHNGNKKIVSFIACNATPQFLLNYPQGRGCDLTLSYVTINGLSGVDVTLPEGSLIESATTLVRSFGSEFVSAELYEVMGENRWQIIGVNAAGNQVSLSGTGLNILLKATLLA